MLSLVTAPAKNPITWEGHVKGHLRLSGEAERQRIEQLLIPAATRWAESETNRALITQTWKLVLDAFPCDRSIALELPKAPLQSVTWVKYVNEDGVLTTWSSSEYVVDAPAGEEAMPGRIWPAYDKSWPTVRTQRNAVEIQFACGYGNADDNVPALIKAAMLLIVGEQFQRREAAIAGTIIAEVPLSARRMIAPFRVPTYRDSYEAAS